MTYLTELDRWNQRLNLTSVPATEVWERHVAESIHLEAVVEIERGAEVIDVGSGAGLPGIVLAVVRPDVCVSLLEADTRKCGFLTHVAGLLGMPSLRVINCRAELAARDPVLREQFDAAVSRAAAAAPVLCELTLPLVRIGGTVAALVSHPVAAARASARAAELCGGGPPLAREGVLLMTKVAATPERFPRRPGVPGRRPLV
ncbi:MAG TPA: 16S rRNA (guanine(527)-N(7))-methyltransferase RsmG [Candidatus Dormibacteraeota bacterium]